MLHIFARTIFLPVIFISPGSISQIYAAPDRNEYRTETTPSVDASPINLKIWFFTNETRPKLGMIAIEFNLNFPSKPNEWQFYSN